MKYTTVSGYVDTWSNTLPYGTTLLLALFSPYVALTLVVWLNNRPFHQPKLIPDRGWLMVKVALSGLRQLCRVGVKTTKQFSHALFLKFPKGTWFMIFFLHCQPTITSFLVQKMLQFITKVNQIEQLCKAGRANCFCTWQLREQPRNKFSYQIYIELGKWLSQMSKISLGSS